MSATLIVALLCAASMVLSCDHAQQGDADTKRFTILRAKAEKGEAQAQSKLADAYFHGHLGLAKNDVEALKWCRKAAEQNNPDAQYSLSLCYANGQGVTTDEAAAVKWLRRAADQDFAPAQGDLGIRYCKGQGVEKDEVEGVKWIRKAADQNDATAQSNLGLCYVLGKGVSESKVDAYVWLSLAAAQDIQSARNNLTKLVGMMPPEQVAAAQRRAKELRAEIEAKLMSTGNSGPYERLNY
jgi:TPR repeat protein